MVKIPEEIVDRIKEQARNDWPGDKDMQRHILEDETEAYIALQEMDYGAALPHREVILKEAAEYSEGWSDRASFVADEIKAFKALQSIDAGDVPADAFAAMKKEAEADSDWFSGRLEHLERSLRHHRYVRDTRAKIEPMRELLTRMEKIVGNSCYNGNIQNYAGRGVLGSEGRVFRYPVTFTQPDDSTLKRWDRQDDIAAEVLINGHYKVGANELSIYRALVKIIDMLETEYGFKLPKAS